MPKLLLVTNYPDRDFVSCAYTFVFLQVEYLKSYFEEVFVVSPTPYFPRLAAPLGRFWPKLADRLAKRDYAYDNVRVFFPRYAPWAGRLPRPRQVTALQRGIDRTIARHGLRFDLVHAHMSPAGWHAVRLKEAFGVPAVLTVHENVQWFQTLLASKDPTLLKAWREADALIRVNPFDIPDLQAIAGPTQRVHYIPNGFDERKVPTASRQQLRAELKLPAERPVLVSVARWDDRKNPLILLEALSRLAADIQPPPLLVLIGEDRMGGRIQQTIAARGLGGHVRLPGQVPPDVVMKHMAAGDMVVLYSWAEGNPTVMFEALGCGRPYIGSDVGGVRAILTDERLGLYGPAGDLDALTGLLRRALHTEWDEAFIRRHAAQYTWRAIAARIHEEIYRPLLRGRAP